MAALLPEYEQQFASISAEITSKICQLDNYDSGGIPPSGFILEKLMTEAKDLLDSMDLEVRECLDSFQKQKLGHRVQSHKVEFTRLQNEYARVKAKNERAELLGVSSGGAVLYNGNNLQGDDMRQQLLEDNDRLDVTSSRLTRSYQVALETETIGAEILSDLHGQRTTIQNARDRLREADHELDTSSRLLTAMMRKALQNRFIAGAAVVIVILFIAIAFYFALR